MTDPNDLNDQPLEHIVDELRTIHADDQYMAALDALAHRVAHYYRALLQGGADSSVATMLTLDYQHNQIGTPR